MNWTASAAAVAAWLCLLSATLPAHGGQYRGPIPLAGYPRTGGGPMAPSLRPVTPGGSGASDPTHWQIWWELNKDPYLRRRPGISARAGDGAGVAITDELKRDVILPALKKALDRNSNRDINSSCMVALAKIGMDHPDFEILPLLRARLKRGDQEIRETAALALGITERADATDDLVALLRDLPAGRRLMGQEKVDDRTRAFAAYGLGLIARANRDADVKAKIFEALHAVLTDRNEDHRDVLVGVINGIRLLQPQPELGAQHKRLLWRSLQVLEQYHQKDLGPGRQVVQAHVAPAIARLLGRGVGGDRDHFETEFASLLKRENSRSHTLSMSAALALGQMVEAAGDDAPAKPSDPDFSAKLSRAASSNRDKQTQYFSMVALAQIGGATNRDRLLKLFKSEKGPTRAWAALSLGVLAYHAADEEAEQDSSSADIIGATLLRELDRIGNRDTKSAAALALGLAHYDKAAPALRKLLKKYRKDENLGGYLCIAVSLMDDLASVPLLEDVISDSKRRPLLMTQAARGLARLQQRGAATTLTAMLRRSSNQTITMAGAAQSLGLVGDASSVKPLVQMLGDESLPKILRAFAGVSLGLIADNRPLPWNSWIALDLNYRAGVGTLANGSSGVLDIL